MTPTTLSCPILIKIGLKRNLIFQILTCLHSRGRETSLDVWTSHLAWWPPEICPLDSVAVPKSDTISLLGMSLKNKLLKDLMAHNLLRMDFLHMYWLKNNLFVTLLHHCFDQSLRKRLVPHGTRQSRLILRQRTLTHTTHRSKKRKWKLTNFTKKVGVRTYSFGLYSW